MPSPGEHVHRLRPIEAVAAVGEDADVAGEGRGVAGDVDDARRRGAEQRPQQFFVGALAGRVEDDGVEALALSDAAGDLFGGVGADEACAIGQAVAPRVLAGVGDRRRDDFHAEHVVRPARRSESDRAHAAIGVEHAQDACTAELRHCAGWLSGGRLTCGNARAGGFTGEEVRA